jgi:tetratricopeptide (TPR) repeat protein
MKKSFCLFFTSILLLSCPLVDGYAQNKQAIDSLETVLKKTTDPGKKVDLLLRISDQFEYVDQQKSLAYAKQAYEKAKQSSDESRLCHSQLRMAKIYYVLSDLKNAMDCAVNAKDIAESENSPLDLALSMDAIGMIYYEIGDESKSSDCFFASLHTYETMNNKTGIGQSLCRIGTLYQKQHENEKAVDYYLRSMNIAKELQNMEGISSNLSNLATVFASENKFPKALTYYREALKLNKEMRYVQLEGMSYLNIGNVYLKLGELDSAITNTRHAYDIFSKLGNQLRFAKAQLNLGEILLAMGKYDQGLNYAQNALEISLRNGYKENVQLAAELLHKIYLNKKDTLSAYKYSILENQWKDSLSLGEKQKTLARLELQYQFDKKEQILRTEKQRRNFVIAILVLCIVFSILIIILLRMRHNLREKKLQLEQESLIKDLDFKKKELTLNVMSLMKKNELITLIANKILQIENETSSDETRSALKKVAKELQKCTEEETLKEFSKRFKEVHDDFYDSLLKNFPSLTPGDLKLCAFLRLNMTTKEISELTGQQISTIENARYRIRQKLSITSSETSLVTFLSQF